MITELDVFLSARGTLVLNFVIYADILVPLVYVSKGSGTGVFQPYLTAKHILCIVLYHHCYVRVLTIKITEKCVEGFPLSGAVLQAIILSVEISLLDVKF